MWNDDEQCEHHHKRNQSYDTRLRFKILRLASVFPKSVGGGYHLPSDGLYAVKKLIVLLDGNCRRIFQCADKWKLNSNSKDHLRQFRAPKALDFIDSIRFHYLQFPRRLQARNQVYSCQFRHYPCFIVQ